ncbi:MAG: hypothetical protein JWN29_367, partial [Acidimicrobiales bacterium]|nr:hypothetical protein [Acidimicrobiales bacterium]
YEQDGEFFLGGAMGHYPNRGVIDAAFSVVHDGVEHSVFASGAMPTDRSTVIGPLRIEVVEPLRAIRYIVGPNDTGLEADVTFRARTEAIEEPRQQIVRNNVPMMDYTRLTQWGTWEGTITLPTGVTLTVDPARTYATRDRSWGVRGVGQQAPTNFSSSAMQVFWLWAPLNFDDCCTHLALFERADGERWLEQALIVPLLPDTSEPEHLARSEYRIEWMPGRREMASASLVLNKKDGTAIPITFEKLYTFRMRGIGYMHPQFSHGSNHGELEVGGESLKLDDFDPLDPASIHIQTLCKVRMGDKVGTGVLEQLAFGPHEPTGLTGILDGYSPS